MNKEIQQCGQCKKQFETVEEYLAHICSVTGFSPINPQHLGDDFKAISEAALKRGEERKAEEIKK